MFAALFVHSTQNKKQEFFLCSLSKVDIFLESKNPGFMPISTGASFINIINSVKVS